MTFRRTLTAVALTAAVLATAVLAAGCGKSTQGGTLTVYSPSGLGAWYEKQFAEFTKQTGVNVTLFEAGSGEVVSRVNSPATW